MKEEESTEMDVDTPPTKTTPKVKQNINVTPSASGDNASKYPDMKLAQSIHRLTMMTGGSLAKLSSEDATSVGISSNLRSSVMKEVGGTGEMENPFLYRHLKSTLSWEENENSTVEEERCLSEEDLVAMEERNKEAMKKLEDVVNESKENAGDMEVLDARFEVARFAAKSLSKDEALEAYGSLLELPKLSSGKKMDALMECSRVASFYGDSKRNGELMDKISKLAEDGGDWDRRNRLKIYKALTKFLARDIKSSASLLVDCIATFSCTEMCTYTEFIVYAMLSNVLYLPRTKLKADIIDGPEILSVANDIPAFSKLVNTLYDCNYKGYLNAMVEVQPFLVADRFLQPHCGYIMRELHVLGYKQFLDSYKSVTLQSMAESFGVGKEYLDLQISRFIAAGRLTAKIDKFNGVVETNRPDLKNAQYRDMIQKGDLLLNRIQKLSRVVDL